MDKALNPRYDIDRLYLLRKEGKRGLTSIEDSVDTSIRRFEDYLKKSKKKKLTIATKNKKTVQGSTAQQ